MLSGGMLCVVDVGEVEGDGMCDVSCGRAVEFVEGTC